MGVVYRCRHLQLKRTVAVKMILAGGHAGPADLERFRTEAEAIARLQQPNIVQIYEVGEQNGLPYFALEFCPGGSLAQKLSGTPLPPREAAALLETLARAMQVAHAKGVIHRDLKPANVLLAEDGTPKITDFGLAKKLDEPGQTASGAVMGTPSYMAPEQAAGNSAAIGPACDIYALGAILYECLTGRPPFRAATPWETVVQVLTDPPAPPRQLQSRTPRDLETICLKCLEKEPHRRYRTAADLADDLGRFRRDEPIRARPIGRWGRTRRWLWKHRRAVSLVGLAVLAILLTLTAPWAWNHYQESRRGYLTLDTDDAGLLAEVFDSDDQLAVPAFTVPNLQAVPIVAGAYRLRLSAPGRLDAVFAFNVDRGARHQYKVKLADRQLWEPIKLNRGEFFDVIEADGHSDFALLTQTGLTRIDGQTGKALWHLDLTSPPPPARTKLPFGTDWQPWWQIVQGEVDYRSRARLMPQPPDLDRDGTPDLLLIGRESLLAVSGKSGVLLWTREFTATADGKAPLHIELIGTPAVADVDGDGTPDLIVSYGTPVDATTRSRRWVEAIAGSSGKTLWRHAVDNRSVANQIPTQPATGHAAQVMTIAGKPTVIVASRHLAQNDIVGLDAHTGAKLWHHDTKHKQATLLAFIPADDGQTTAVFADAAVDLPGGKTRWMSTFASPQQAQLTDLDGDGKPELLLIDADRLVVLDSSTGTVRWQKPFTLPAQAIRREMRFTVGPDVNGDGVRDVYQVTLGDDLHLEARSGKDGGSLWATTLPQPHDQRRPNVGELSWWQPGADGQPLLVICLVGVNGARDAVEMIEATTGRRAHRGADVGVLRSADLDGDGLADLYWFRPTATAGGLREGGVLHTMRGMPAVLWQRLEALEPAGDLDGDGVIDLVNPGPAAVREKAQRAFAVSGRDGHLLWQTDRPVARLYPLPLPHGDLDGDGVADLATFGADGRLQLGVISGKTGQPLWTNRDLGNDWYTLFREVPGQRGETLIGPRFVAPCDLDDDGRPAIITDLMADDHVAIAALSGRDGKTLWKQPWLDHSKAPFGRLTIEGIVDLRDDNCRAIVVSMAGGPDGNERWLAAFRGTDGKLLWQKEGKTAGNTMLVNTDGRQSLVIAAAGQEPPQVVTIDSAVVALDIRDGRSLWTWQWPDRALREVSQVAVRTHRDGQRSPGISLAVGNQLIVLDGKGQLQRQLAIPGQCGYWCGRRDTPLWYCDLDGNGKDDLALVSCERRDFVSLAREKAAVRVLADGGERLLWQWPFPSGFGEIVAAFPAQAGREASVVVRSGNSILGLAGPTGKVQWRCEGLPWWFTRPDGLPEARDYHRNGPQLLGRHAQDGIYVFFQSNLCRRALPTNADGTYARAMP
jgi:outer membrane protein assembly factor BamB